MDAKFDWSAYDEVAASHPERRVRLAVVTSGNDVSDRFEIEDVEWWLGNFVKRYSRWFHVSILDVVPPADQTC